MTEQEQKIIFSNNLNALLIEFEKTQLEVAEAIDVSPQTFNTWCKGKALPRMGKVQKLADYFGINKSDLIDRKVNGNTKNIMNEYEKKLINICRHLNHEGQEKVLEYAEMIDALGTYNIYPDSVEKNA